MAGRDEFKQTAEETPLDNSTIDCLDTAENVQEGFEELCDRIDTGIIGQLYPMIFARDSSSQNKWIGHNSENVISNATPGLMPFKSKLISITFSNSKKGADADLEVRVADAGSGTLNTKILDLPIRNKRVQRWCNFNPQVILEAGDKVAIYVQDQGTNVKDVAIVLYWQIIEDTNCSGSEDFSGNIGTGSIGTTTV